MDKSTFSVRCYGCHEKLPLDAFKTPEHAWCKKCTKNNKFYWWAAITLTITFWAAIIYSMS